MIPIDESWVDAAAPNAAASKNGRGLVSQGKFIKLCKTPDETLIFGECQGSGKANYSCSCDFIQADSPTHRCSCPSRQFPCKHCLGLLYAWVQAKPFKVAELPAELADKRDKLASRRDRQEVVSSQPRKVDKAALNKKIQAQLQGLDLLEQLTHDLLRMGMGNTNAKTAAQVEEQAKQLGNAFVPGAQAALHDYTRLFADTEGRFDAQAAHDREPIYGEALDRLTRLHALTKQGRTYLKRRLEDPELAPDTSSSIAAWLGHAWQLRELREAGLVEKDVELMQLAFSSHDDVARREYIDTGIWLNLGSGRIALTQTFRPYKAVKFIKGDDSFFQVARVEELCVYPGDVNPRVRWEAMQTRPLAGADLEAVRGHGRGDFAALIKEVKGQLKAPLADKHPVYALNYARLATARSGDLVVEDAAGNRLVLSDAGLDEEPASCHLLSLVSSELLSDQTLVGRFHHDLQSQRLCVKPLSIVSESLVVRLI